MQRSRALTILVYALIVVISVWSLFPLLWGVSTSVKVDQDIFTSPPRWIPARATLEHYYSTFIVGQFYRNVLNSLFISAVATAISLVVGVLAAYSLARFRFVGNSVVLVLILASMTVPGLTNLIPIYVMLAKLKLLSSVDDVRRLVREWVVQQQNKFNPYAHERSEVEQEQHHHRRNQRRNRHMPQPTQTAGSIHQRRLVLLRIDPRHGSQVDDGPESQTLPDVRRNVDRSKKPRLLQESNGRHVEQAPEQVVHHSLRTDYLHHQSHDDRTGQEVREVRHCLCYPLYRRAVQLVQQQSKQDRCREAEGQAVQVQQKRVAHDAPRIEALEEVLELLQPYPGTLYETQVRTVVLERYHDSCHGQVVENHEIGDGRKEQEYQIPIVEDGLSELRSG